MFEAMDAEVYAAHKSVELPPSSHWRQRMARQMNPAAGELTETLEEITVSVVNLKQ
jgi:hypothetical protein